MQVINTIIHSETFTVILKLLLSSLLAGFIGLERSSLNKPAGFGTHAIIGLSAALVVMASQYMATNYDIDASRIPSQIIAGIGFIGAGTILRNGVNVRGVTTAAGILSVTCIGIAVGIGYYIPAIITTAIVFFVLSVNHNVSEKMERVESLDLSIDVAADNPKELEEIQSLLKKETVILQSITKEEKIVRGVKIYNYRIVATFDSKYTSKPKIIGKLIAREKVIEVVDEMNVAQ